VSCTGRRSAAAEGAARERSSACSTREVPTTPRWLALVRVLGRCDWGLSGRRVGSTVSLSESQLCEKDNDRLHVSSVVPQSQMDTY
jgi:hypothetical protein